MDNISARLRPDALSDVLSAVRFRSTIFCRSELAAPWGFSVVRRPLAVFHFLERGNGTLDVDGIAGRFQLGAGDLVILPHGHGHRVRDRAKSRVDRLEDLLADHPLDDQLTMRVAPKGSAGPVTSMVCGGFTAENGTIPFASALPPVLHVPAGTSPWLSVLQEALGRELTMRRAGADAVLGRIADLMYVEAVRAYFADATGEPRGWVAALREPNIGEVLARIHRDPAKDWTVGTLAKAAAMSRSAFAVRFSVLLGESPMRYVARFRVSRALGLLSSTERTVASIAQSVGYDSALAFARAFRRQVGLSPTAYRRSR